MYCMLSLAHTVLSLPFGIYIDNIFIIFAAAFVGHLLFDTVLHWNIYPDRFSRYPFELVALDVFAGLGLAYFITGDQFFETRTLVAIAGGNAPDVLHGLWEFMSKPTRKKYFSWAQPFFTFHDKLQLETKSVWRGLAWQVVGIAIVAFII